MQAWAPRYESFTFTSVGGGPQVRSLHLHRCHTNVCKVYIHRAMQSSSKKTQLRKLRIQFSQNTTLQIYKINNIMCVYRDAYVCVQYFVVHVGYTQLLCCHVAGRGQHITHNTVLSAFLSDRNTYSILKGDILQVLPPRQQILCCVEDSRSSRELQEGVAMWRAMTSVVASSSRENYGKEEKQRRKNVLRKLRKSCDSFLRHRDR